TVVIDVPASDAQPLPPGSGYTYYKYNATTGAWSAFPGASISSVMIGGTSFLEITLNLVDGGAVDDDGRPPLADGNIIDPGALGIPAPPPPTVTVKDANGPYTGSPFQATATAIDASDNDITGQGPLSYTYYAGSSASGTSLNAVPVNAGTYT